MRVRIGAEPMSIVELYDRVAVACDIEPAKVATYDCMKVRVAKNLYDAVHEYYQQKCGDEVAVAFGMNWLCYGPKVDETLADGVVEYDDGFFG